MNNADNKGPVTWDDLTAFTANRSSWTDEDWVEGIRLAESLDPSTIPEGIEIPDLRPREIIEAEAREKQAKKSS